MKLNYAEITIIIGMLKQEERKSAERCEVAAANVEFAKDRFQGWLQDYRKRAKQVDHETAEKTIDQAFEELVIPSKKAESKASHSRKLTAGRAFLPVKLPKVVRSPQGSLERR